MADAVFSGSVINLQTDARLVTATIIVHELWKGSITDTIAVTTPADWRACGVDFQVPNRYLVLGHVDENDKLRASSCSTRLYDGWTLSELEELGRPRAVFPYHDVVYPLEKP